MRSEFPRGDRAESAEQQQQEERCDARLWYVDMLRAGALLGQLSAEQRRVRAAVETLLSQPGSAGDAVLCETLRMYERVLRPAATTQDDETEPAVEEVSAIKQLPVQTCKFEGSWARHQDLQSVCNKETPLFLTPC